MEKMLVTASRHFTQEQIQSTVLGQGADHSFAAELRDSGYDVRTIPYRVGSFSGMRELQRLVEDLSIDVIHIHTEGDYLRTALASWWVMGRAGAVVRTIHNVFQATGTWWVKRFIQAQIADRLVYALIGPSPEVAANEKKLFRKVHLVYNWVDDIFFQIRESRRGYLRAHDDGVVAVIVGNCSKIKHHELALRALMATNHRVIHLGNEDDAGHDELQLLRSLNEDGRLIGRGVKPPQEALMKATYFMMPSRHEGMGVALAEALVSGVPALVNDVPGLRWARGIDGVVMLPGTEDAWASAVLTWPEDREDMSTSAPDFSASRGASEYAVIYREAAAQRMSRKRSSSEGNSRVGMD